MFGKVKRWLGIEGVKVELLIPDKISGRETTVDGVIRFYSMHDQTIERVRVRLIEKFKRGRRSKKLVDEYTLGEISQEQLIEVPAHQYIDLSFSLPFNMVMSDMDKFESRNFLFRRVARSAKLLRGAKSEFRIEAEADVRGTALSPFDTGTLEISL